MSETLALLVSRDGDHVRLSAPEVGRSVSALMNESGCRITVLNVASNKILWISSLRFHSPSVGPSAGGGGAIGLARRAGSSDNARRVTPVAARRPA